MPNHARLSAMQWVATALFVVALLLAGGSSRSDISQLMAVRLAALLVIGVIILPAARAELRALVPPLLLPAAVALLCVLSLIPLPPALWSALPGHAGYDAAATIAGKPQPWRPLTLSPDLTIETILALLVPVATVALAMRAPLSWARHFAPALLAVTALSGALATLQLVSDADSPLRLYAINDTDAGVGFFANRNHQAVLMCLGLPAAYFWAVAPGTPPARRLAKRMVALAAALLAGLGVAITQSRSGYVLAVSMILAIGLIAATSRSPSRRATRLTGIAIVALCLIGTSAMVAPIARFGDNDVGNGRGSFWQNTIDMAQAFFPTGSGPGSFVRAYPRFEKMADLRPEYVNHAHNDYLEIVAEYGLAGAFGLALGLVWIGRAITLGWGLDRVSLRPPAQLAAIALVVMLVASLVDYPVRTPLMGSLFALACIVLYRLGNLKNDHPQVAQ
ncbi:O-antigen ligase [Sphingomonas sp.]|uniref:O-antigen ligase family protein n=1 Tax=Sphingomonas sp. TaxID=28214 RepID=UPI001DAD6DF3|nr:O-antigen ligase family protein [Sphingomonas sp.]MBX9796003.1 O-antigen ligase family protein [Sphingomonas sp.]